METPITEIPQSGLIDLEAPPLSLKQLVWLRFKRHKMALAGAVMLVLLILYATVGSLFFTESYGNITDTSIRLQAPSAEHPFGTDTVGRDLLARTIYGGQISLMIGIIAVFIVLIVGVSIGAISGYFGGWIDSVLMRFTEAVFNIPTIPLLLVLSKMLSNKVPTIELFSREFSGSVVVITGVIGFTSWMGLARLVRANFLSLKEQEFVTAAKSIGASNFSIIFEHILPNTVAPIIVSATLGVANAIINEAYVSFLGVGVMPPTATWGNMLNGAYRYIETAPWTWIFPGTLIVLTVLSINFVGDGLRDALDPRALVETD